MEDQPRAKGVRKIDEDSVPLFWPLAAAYGMEEAELALFKKNLKFFAEAQKIDHGLEPRFATANAVVLDLHTMGLRDFGDAKSRAVPALATRRMRDTPPPSSTTARARAWSKRCSPTGTGVCWSPTGRALVPT